MLDVRYSHLYFYQSLNRLQRGLSAIAELLVKELFNISRYGIFLNLANTYGKMIGYIKMSSGKKSRLNFDLPIRYPNPNSPWRRSAFSECSCSSFAVPEKWHCHRSDTSIVFTALHGMQTRSSNKILSVRLSVRSVRPSVCQTRASWQNGRKICLHFYTIRKII